MAKKAKADCTEYTYYCNGREYRIFAGKDGVTEADIIILREEDHKAGLLNRYDYENRDKAFEFLKDILGTEESNINPIESLADSTYAPEAILFAENKQITRAEIIEELIPFITPDQEKLYRYLCMGLKAKEIAKIFNTSEDAIKKRKTKLIARFQKLFHEKYPEGLPKSGNRQEPKETAEVSRFPGYEPVSLGGNK